MKHAKFSRYASICKHRTPDLLETAAAEELASVAGSFATLAQQFAAQANKLPASDGHRQYLEGMACAFKTALGFLRYSDEEAAEMIATAKPQPEPIPAS